MLELKRKLIDAIDGEKWDKFVAMQQDSATLICDLNTMKETVDSYLKKIERPFRTEQLQALEIAPSSISLKKQKTVLSHLNSRN